MSDLRGLSTPPTMETGNNTAKFVSAFVVAAVAVGAGGYVYVAGHARHPAHQALATNDVHMAALPSNASRVAPPIVSPTPAPNTNPTPEAAPVAANSDDEAPAKAVHPTRIAHTNSNSFMSRPSDAAPSSDAVQPAPALNVAPQQAVPQENQTAPQQSAPAQNPLAPTAEQPAPTNDQNNPQSAPDQQTPPQ